VMIALWVAVFGVLVWRRHDRFGSFGFDMGIYDQAVWLAAHGGSFITVRGLDLFGHHANVAFYLLAPFSWLGAGPHFLNLVQVGSLAACTVPLFLLGRDRIGNPWLALVVPVVFLLHPSTQFLAWELFHPETMAIAPLLFAYLAARRERWGWYAVLLVFAVAWKEDVALAAFALGAVVAVRGNRRVGGITMALSLGWFLFVNRILLTAVNGQGAFYDQFYGDLGSSPFEILGTAFTDPGLVVDRFTGPESVEFVWQMVAPFAGVPLLAPLALLLGLPQLVANLLSIHGFTREITFHYAALPLAALSLAAVEALAFVVRRVRTVAVGRALGGLMVVAAIAATIQWGPSPIGARYDDGYWPRPGDVRKPSKEAGLAAIPDGAPVSATYQFVPHLSHRRAVYEFPNPFGERNWGVRGENRHDPEVVRWLIADTLVMGQEDRTLVESIAHGPDWEIVMELDGIVVARRIGAVDAAAVGLATGAVRPAGRR